MIGGIQVNYNEQLNQEIAEHFDKAAHLNTLIEKNVNQIALNVLAQTGGKLEHLDSAKMGCYMAWVQRLVTLLPESQIQWLTDNLEGKDA